MCELGLISTGTKDQTALSELYSSLQKPQAANGGDPFSELMGEPYSAANHRIKQHLSLVSPTQEPLEVIALIDSEWYDAQVKGTQLVVQGKSAIDIKKEGMIVMGPTEVQFDNKNEEMQKIRVKFKSV